MENRWLTAENGCDNDSNDIKMNEIEKKLSHNDKLLQYLVNTFDSNDNKRRVSLQELMWALHNCTMNQAVLKSIDI